jgi:hypothetical protein
MVQIQGIMFPVLELTNLLIPEVFEILEAMIMLQEVEVIPEAIQIILTFIPDLAEEANHLESTLLLQEQIRL